MTVITFWLKYNYLFIVLICFFLGKWNVICVLWHTNLSATKWRGNPVFAWCNKYSYTFCFFFINFWNNEVSVELFGICISIWMYSFRFNPTFIGIQDGLIHLNFNYRPKCHWHIVEIILELVKMGSSKKHWQEGKNKISIL